MAGMRIRIITVISNPLELESWTSRTPRGLCTSYSDSLEQIMSATFPFRLKESKKNV